MKVKKLNFENENVTVILPKAIEIPLELTRHTPLFLPCILVLFKLLGCEIKGDDKKWKQY